jgi:hypothetical protein
MNEQQDKKSHEIPGAGATPQDRQQGDQGNERHPGQQADQKPQQQPGSANEPGKQQQSQGNPSNHNPRDTGTRK